MIRDLVYIGVIFGSVIFNYATTTSKANEAYNLASENKAYGIANEKKHTSNNQYILEEIKKIEKNTREYAREYAYRKNLETSKEVKENTNNIYVAKQDIATMQAKYYHIEKNQEKIISILEIIRNKSGK